MASTTASRSGSLARARVAQVIHQQARPVAFLAPGVAHGIGHGGLCIPAQCFHILQIPGPVVIIFAGVGIEHLLERIRILLIAQYVAVQVAKAHDEKAHLREKTQPVARQKAVIAHAFEQRLPPSFSHIQVRL